MSDLWKKYKKYMAAAGISIIVLLALIAFYVRYDYQQYCKELCRYWNIMVLGRQMAG